MALAPGAPHHPLPHLKDSSAGGEVCGSISRQSLPHTAPRRGLAIQHTAPQGHQVASAAADPQDGGQASHGHQGQEQLSTHSCIRACMHCVYVWAHIYTCVHTVSVHWLELCPSSYLLFTGLV